MGLLAGGVSFYRFSFRGLGFGLYFFLVVIFRGLRGRIDVFIWF